MSGPWLLYDNAGDPYQLENLVNSDNYASLRSELDTQLDVLLVRYHDAFLSGQRYIERWGYEVDATGTVPYTD
jgi:hypothetical protein